ncbi:transglutaminase family protein [Sphingomonas sp. CJ20]
MRIAIEHRTRYRFTEPQARLVQVMRLTPCDTASQTVVSWMVGVDCDARMRDAVDGFGNAVTMLYAEGPLDAIDVTVTGEVLTGDTSGIVRGAPEPLPPMLFLRETPRTAPNAALRDFAADATGAATSLLDRVHRLNAALHARFPCLPDAPDTGTSAAQAFAGEAATSRDVAQMFIAAARSLDVPARYVSGYHLAGGTHVAPHAWAEAHVAGIGWIGFDSVTGLSPDAGYVRVAVGLDAAGAASIVGTRIGHGDEALDVDLNVDRLGGEE